MTLLPLREQTPANVPPLVSVSVLSYNQAAYLSRALDSVLDQRVDFPCEIIVGDDCSDDDSPAVLEAYRAKYPHLIRLHLHQNRIPDEIPGRRNNVNNLTNCRGEFTATLDGDDYWCSPDKLQLQIDALRTTPGVTMSCHDSLVLYEGRQDSEREVLKYSDLVRRTTITGGEYDIEWLCRQPSIPFHISSVVFRTRALHPLPDYFDKILAADQAMVYQVVSKGKFIYHGRSLSVRWFGTNNFTHSNQYGSDEYTLLKVRDTLLFEEALPSLRRNGTFTKRRNDLLYNLSIRLLRRGKVYRGVGYLRQVPPHVTARRLVGTVARALGLRRG